MNRNSRDLVMERMIERGSITVPAGPGIRHQVGIAESLGMHASSGAVDGISEMVRQDILRRVVCPVDPAKTPNHGVPSLQIDQLRYEFNLRNPGVLLTVLQYRKGISFEYIATVHDLGWERYLLVALGQPAASTDGIADALQHIENAEEVNVTREKIADTELPLGAKGERMGDKYHMTITPR